MYIPATIYTRSIVYIILVLWERIPSGRRYQVGDTRYIVDARKVVSCYKQKALAINIYSKKVYLYLTSRPNLLLMCK